MARQQTGPKLELESGSAVWPGVTISCSRGYDLLFKFWTTGSVESYPLGEFLRDLGLTLNDCRRALARTRRRSGEQARAD